MVKLNVNYIYDKTIIFPKKVCQYLNIKFKREYTTQKIGPRIYALQNRMQINTEKKLANLSWKM